MTPPAAGKPAASPRRRGVCTRTRVPDAPTLEYRNRPLRWLACRRGTAYADRADIRRSATSTPVAYTRQYTVWGWQGSASESGAEASLHESIERIQQEMEHQ